MDILEQLNNISIAVQTLVVLGIAMRIVFCFIKLQHEAQEAETYKKRIKNSIVIAIFVVSIFSIYDIIAYYY